MLNLSKIRTMPRNHHALHAFDLRSVVLFTCLTMGGTSAVMAQTTPFAPAASTASAAMPSAPLQPITASEAFARSDRDRNGELSREEAQNLPSVAEQFDAWDRDGNGTLSLEEFLLNVQNPPK